MADVQVGGMLDFGTSVVIGVDPGTKSTGVCLMRGDGTPRKSWSIRAPDASILERLKFISFQIGHLFDLIVPAVSGREVIVVIEDGMFGGRKKPKIVINPSGEEESKDFSAKISGIAGEVRGLVMAEAWRRGWSVRKVYPVSWKSGMTKPERAMKKDAQYTAYWSRRLAREFRTPDEVDATLIGIHGARR